MRLPAAFLTTGDETSVGRNDLGRNVRHSSAILSISRNMKPKRHSDDETVSNRYSLALSSCFGFGQVMSLYLIFTVRNYR